MIAILQIGVPLGVVLGYLLTVLVKSFYIGNVTKYLFSGVILFIFNVLVYQSLLLFSFLFQMNIFLVNYKIEGVVRSFQQLVGKMKLILYTKKVNQL